MEILTACLKVNMVCPESDGNRCNNTFPILMIMAMDTRMGQDIQLLVMEIPMVIMGSLTIMGSRTIRIRLIHNISLIKILITDGEKCIF